MVSRLFTGNFYAGGTKLQLGIAYKSWLQKIEVIRQIRWEWKLHVQEPLRKTLVASGDREPIR